MWPGEPVVPVTQLCKPFTRYAVSALRRWRHSWGWERPEPLMPLVAVVVRCRRRCPTRTLGPRGSSVEECLVAKCRVPVKAPNHGWLQAKAKHKRRWRNSQSSLRGIFGENLSL